MKMEITLKKIFFSFFFGFVVKIHARTHRFNSQLKSFIEEKMLSSSITSDYTFPSEMTNSKKKKEGKLLALI